MNPKRRPVWGTGYLCSLAGPAKSRPKFPWTCPGHARLLIPNWLNSRAESWLSWAKAQKHDSEQWDINQALCPGLLSLPASCLAEPLQLWGNSRGPVSLAFAGSAEVMGTWDRRAVMAEYPGDFGADGDWFHGVGAARAAHRPVDGHQPAGEPMSEVAVPRSADPAHRRLGPRVVAALRAKGRRDLLCDSDELHARGGHRDQRWHPANSSYLYPSSQDARYLKAGHAPHGDSAGRLAENRHRDQAGLDAGMAWRRLG